MSAGRGSPSRASFVACSQDPRYESRTCTYESIWIEVTHEQHDMAAAMDVMVTALKDNVRRIAPETVRAFIESQPDVRVPVSIVSTREASEGAGASNGLLMFTAQFGAGEGASTRELVLRYQPFNEVRTFRDANIGAQFDVQTALQHTDVRTPKPLWVDRTGAALGTPGYVMEQVEGEVPAGAYFASGLLGDVSPEKRRAMLFDILANLAKIHRVDWYGLGLREESMPAAGAGERPLERFISYYWDLWTWVDPPEKDSLIVYRDWLLENQPDISHPVLIHGDPSCHNYLFSEGRVSAVLDFELAAIGPAELDLVLQYFVIDLFSRSMGGVDGVPSEDEYHREYERLTGATLTDLDYYRTLGIIVPTIIVKAQERQMQGPAAEASRATFALFWQALEARRALHGF